VEKLREEVRMLLWDSDKSGDKVGIIGVPTLSSEMDGFFAQDVVFFKKKWGQKWGRKKMSIFKKIKEVV